MSYTYPPTGIAAGKDWTNTGVTSPGALVSARNKKWQTTVGGAAYGNGVYEVYSNSECNPSDAASYNFFANFIFDRLSEAYPQDNQRRSWTSGSTTDANQSTYPSDGSDKVDDVSKRAYVAISLPEHITLSSYSLQIGHTDGGNQNFRLTQGPRKWTLEGSNDGTNFTAVDSQSGVSWTTTSQTKTFTVTNSGLFRIYKLTVIAVNSGSNVVCLADISLTGTPLPFRSVITKPTLAPLVVTPTATAVSTTTRPCFDVASINPTVSSAGYLSFNTEHYDPNGAISTGGFTCPTGQSGVYRFSFFGFALGTGAALQLEFRKDSASFSAPAGSIASAFADPTNTNPVIPMMLEIIVPMTQGQTLSVYMYSGSLWGLAGSDGQNSSNNFFTGELISN